MLVDFGKTVKLTDITVINLFLLLNTLYTLPSYYPEGLDFQVLRGVYAVRSHVVCLSIDILKVRGIV